MKLISLYLAATLLACSVSAANSVNTVADKTPDYSMVLVGGGLATCSSTATRYCSSADLFSASSKSAEMFSLSAANLTNIANAEFWGAERVIEQQQTLAVLEYVRSRLGNELVNERELLRLWRAAEIEIDGIWVSGRVNFAALTEREQSFVLDQLQVKVTADKDSKRSGNRLKEYADLANTKNGFSVEIYQKIVELAKQVAGPLRKPRLLVVTASSRDPFAPVDFYTNLFNEAGAEASWLPINAAYQAAQQQADPKAACDKLPQLLAEKHGTYQRTRVYPDLMAQFEQFCKSGSDAAVEQIRKADAIFFNGGDQSLLLQAFKLADGESSPELIQLDRMLSAGQIVVAGTSAGTAVMSGRSYQGRKTPMISNGDSYNAMQFGAFDLPAPQPGCDKDQSCSSGLAENHLTFSSTGGLGLFPWGVLDTHFSERGRQGRLIRLLNDTQSRFGFGIDEATALMVKIQQLDSGTKVDMEVLGQGGVYIVDTQKAESSGEGNTLSLRKVATHYLTRGDEVELKDGLLRTRFADWKFAPNNMQMPMLTSGDIFERDNYRQLAQLLCLTQTRQADGKAVRVGEGHQITLYKDLTSYARQGLYRQQDKELQYCSYRNILVDIVPAQ